MKHIIDSKIHSDVISLEMMLYRNDLNDRLLLHHIYNSYYTSIIDEHTLLTLPVAVSELIDDNFSDRLNNVATFGQMFKKEAINSITFLKSMLDDMPNLRMLRIRISDSENFSRFMGGDSGIMFDFRMLNVHIKLYDTMTKRDIRLFKALCHRSGIYLGEAGITYPYLSLPATKLRDMLNTLDESDFDKYESMVASLQTCISERYLIDDSNLHIITDM